MRDIRKGQRSVVDPFHGTHGAREGTDVLLHAWGKNGTSWEPKKKRSRGSMGEMGVFQIRMGSYLNTIYPIYTYIYIYIYISTTVSLMGYIPIR